MRHNDPFGMEAAKPTAPMLTGCNSSPRGEDIADVWNITLRILT